jgi:hypothetical protein
MKWDFKYRPDRQYHYEAYRSPQLRDSNQVYRWCWDTYGQPGPEQGWDCHGGWIKLKGEEEMIMFKLRWPDTSNDA